MMSQNYLNKLIKHFILAIYIILPAGFSEQGLAATAPSHIAVIDAGSSGTRLYFYKISQDGKIDMLISNFEYKEEDGIDNYVCAPNTPQSDVMRVVITPSSDQVEAAGQIHDATAKDFHDRSEPVSHRGNAKPSTGV